MQLRRLGAVTLSAGVLLLFTAACGGSESPSPAGSSEGADFSQQGDIEYWSAKDVTGNQDKLIEQFNAQHPQGKVVLHILPEAADQQRIQMLQNAQIKNAKMTVLSVDNVWTAEFAANGIIRELPADQFPTDTF